MSSGLLPKEMHKGTVPRGVQHQPQCLPACTTDRQPCCAVLCCLQSAHLGFTTQLVWHPADVSRVGWVQRPMLQVFVMLLLSRCCCGPATAQVAPPDAAAGQQERCQDDGNGDNNGGCQHARGQTTCSSGAHSARHTWAVSVRQAQEAS